MASKKNTGKSSLLAQAKPAESWRAMPLYKKENRAWLKKSVDIALAVQDILESKKMTQTELAEKLNVSRQHVSKILKGQENLTLETISRLEAVLKTSLITVTHFYASDANMAISRVSED